MSNMTPNKPYFIRAMYDWIVDNDHSPYLLVDASLSCVEVPQQFVSDGKIVLDISPSACRGLHINDDRIVFTAKFSGISTQIIVHPLAVLAIYSGENKRGMEFGPEYNLDYPETIDVTDMADKSTTSKSKAKKPFLKLVDKDE